MKQVLVIAVLLVLVLPTLAQDDACATLAIEALQVAGANCAALGMNEACYGHDAVTATVSAGTVFAGEGDLASLLDVEMLTTEAADPDAGTWGVAMLTVQADLPLGETLTLVLVGDATLADAPVCTLTADNNINVRAGPGTDQAVLGVLNAGQTAQADRRNEAGDWVHIEAGELSGWLFVSLATLDCPVEELSVEEYQAFVLSSGTGTCEAAPDGLLIRSPEGQRARVVVNGVQLEFASTAFITAERDAFFTLTGLEGEITVTSAGVSITITPGTQTQVPLDDLQADGPPSQPQTVDTSGLALFEQPGGTSGGAAPAEDASPADGERDGTAPNIRPGVWLLTAVSIRNTVNGVVNEVDPANATPLPMPIQVIEDGAALTWGNLRFERVAPGVYVHEWSHESEQGTLRLEFTSPTTATYYEYVTQTDQGVTIVHESTSAAVFQE